MTNKVKNRLYYEKNKDKILIQRKQKREKEKSSKSKIDVQIPDQLNSQLFRQKSCDIIKLGSRRDFDLRLLNTPSSVSDSQKFSPLDLKSDELFEKSSPQKKLVRSNIMILLLVFLLIAITAELIFLQYEFMSQNGAPGLANFSIAVTIELIPIALMFCRCASWAMNIVSKGIALSCVILTLGVTSISVFEQSKSKSSSIALQKRQLEIDRLAIEEQQRTSSEVRELEILGLTKEMETQDAVLNLAIKDKAWGVMKAASTNIANATMRISDLRHELQKQIIKPKNQASVLRGDENLVEVSGWILVGIRAILLVSSLFFASYLSKAKEWLRSGDKVASVGP